MTNTTPNNSPITTTPPLHIGAAYYPEHWPEERWPEDIRLMKEAGLTVARMAEFAWSTLEPTAGNFRFDWLERAIQMLAENGIVSVLGTPTAAPPAWLTYANPDSFAMDEYGRHLQHGNRCHYCPTSPAILEASRRITEAMAKQFGPNPAVIGWQTDNELGRVCFCGRCRSLFQEYLAKRYGSLDNLNQRWSTAYWSQTYTRWDQIPAPIGYHNPGLLLEWKRFITQSNRRFQKLQVDILRSHLRPEVWISHNFMGWFDGFDHYELSADIDMASWDHYVGTGHHDYPVNGATHDLTRGFKRRNFWVMETQPGCVNWAGVNTMLDKGEARVMAWQGVAHGADAILYWQWRSAHGGQEQYHGSLVDQAGRPRPFYEEVAQLGKEFAMVSDLIAGSVPKATVAMLHSYESRWAIQWQRHHQDFDPVKHFLHYYRPLATRNIQVDILGADHLSKAEPFAGYRMVIAPSLNILHEGVVDALREYVKRGGHLVLTARCGMKDTYNAMLPLRQPGPLAEMAGVEVEDYYALLEPVPVKGNWFEGQTQIWAERLRPLDKSMTTAIARYGKSNGWLDDQMAITVNGYGNGLVYYVGAYLDDASQLAFMNHVLKTASCKPWPTPEGVEVSRRVKLTGEEIFFIINHKNVAQTISIPWPAIEYLSGTLLQGELTLPPYGVAILTH